MDVWHCWLTMKGLFKNSLDPCTLLDLLNFFCNSAFCLLGSTIHRTATMAARHPPWKRSMNWYVKQNLKHQF